MSSGLMFVINYFYGIELLLRQGNVKLKQYRMERRGEASEHITTSHLSAQDSLQDFSHMALPIP